MAEDAEEKKPGRWSWLRPESSREVEEAG